MAALAHLTAIHGGQMCESGRVPVGCNARHPHLIVLRHTSPISTEQSENTSVAPTAPMTWMARLKRVFDIDIRVCPNCGGQLRVIGEVTEPKTIARILEHACPRRG
jgi:transposase